jgi:hypothetical protein
MTRRILFFAIAAIGMSLIIWVHNLVARMAGLGLVLAPLGLAYTAWGSERRERAVDTPLGAQVWYVDSLTRTAGGLAIAVGGLLAATHAASLGERLLCLALTVSGALTAWVFWRQRRLDRPKPDERRKRGWRCERRSHQPGQGRPELGPTQRYKRSIGKGMSCAARTTATTHRVTFDSATVLRPRPWLRIALPLAAACLLAFSARHPAADITVVVTAIGIGAAIEAGYAWGAKLELQGERLARSWLFVRIGAIDVSDLKSTRLRRDFSTGPIPRRVLHLVDNAGNELRLQPMWWGDVRSAFRLETSRRNDDAT